MSEYINIDEPATSNSKKFRFSFIILAIILSIGSLAAVIYNNSFSGIDNQFKTLNFIENIAVPAAPTFYPTYSPSFKPTLIPSSKPTFFPSANPTIKPTKLPTSKPSKIPSTIPTTQPSSTPSAIPTAVPTKKPIGQIS